MSKHTGTFYQWDGVSYRSVDYVMTSTGGNPKKEGEIIICVPRPVTEESPCGMTL